ncbi:flavodoxin family protein [Paenibacillus caseinilyticus]|uniref:NAD(P)H-dependent oxidoreductase n=1 Tax=Paenibacillus mucilaginosus K02 TaxID=997761 RepID=I0BM24_9BACL|nr:flavodoxin family protein [Paenibacillus mucilaginosus]AFH63421.1 NAD(P)H-dependent oxidoreductase [Paenibacillus mucilaginosus K02]
MGIAVLYGSSRRNGNTDILAARLAEGREADHLYLSDYRLQPIVDYRHEEPGPYPDDDYHELIGRVLAADALVFATPIYWYGISGVLKTFFDRWSQSLRESRKEFLAGLAGKPAYVIAVGDDDPQVKGQPLVQQFRYIFDFTGIRLAGHVIGTANKPGDILQDAQALAVIDRWRAEWKNG